MPQFTDEQIELTIAAAIRDGKVEVVPALIKMLAGQNPAHAEVIAAILEGGHEG